MSGGEWAMLVVLFSPLVLCLVVMAIMESAAFGLAVGILGVVLALGSEGLSERMEDNILACSLVVLSYSVFFWWRKYVRSVR